MLKITAFGVFITFCCATAVLAQETEGPASRTIKSATKEATPQGASAASDKNVQANELVADQSQTSGVGSSVECAIKVSDPADRSAGPSILLDRAKECRNSSGDNTLKNPTVGLNDRLFLSVSLSGGQLTAADKTPAKLEDWRLLINGVEINDSQLTWEARGDTMAVLSAKLKRTDSSKAAWNELLAQKLKEHTVPVTIIDASKKPLSSEAYFNLQVIQLKWYSWTLLGILLILMIILLTHDRMLDMLREDGPFKFQGKAGFKAAYSLARVQMFYWFSIAIVCYVLIWIITGDRDTINNDVLTLMGISAGTFLGAVAIDSSKKSQAQSDLPDAAGKLQQTQTAATTLAGAGPAAAPSAAVVSQAVNSQQDALVQLTDRRLADYHENFLTDILSDEDGLSFHRFQIFAWSLVLGVIFVTSVIQTLSMPTFGNTLLGLMGLSGGTYLGFKFPEQKTK